MASARGRTAGPVQGRPHADAICESFTPVTVGNHRIAGPLATAQATELGAKRSSTAPGRAGALSR